MIERIQEVYNRVRYDLIISDLLHERSFREKSASGRNSVGGTIAVSW